MGRKSGAKAQARQTGASGAGPSNPPSGSRSFPPLLIVAIVLLAGAALPQTPADVPAAAKLGPHPQENLPALPFMPEPPARSMDVVRASYKFAAEHPEVLSYVPCYCGCERSGHRGNEDCFVTRRDDKNDVVEWEPHGMT